MSRAADPKWDSEFGLHFSKDVSHRKRFECPILRPNRGTEHLSASSQSNIYIYILLFALIFAIQRDHLCVEGNETIVNAGL